MTPEREGEIRRAYEMDTAITEWDDFSYDAVGDLLTLVDSLRADVARLTGERDAARLGCDVLSVGDPYERLGDTLDAARIVARERDEARAELRRLRAAPQPTVRTAAMAMKAARDAITDADDAEALLAFDSAWDAFFAALGDAQPAQSEAVREAVKEAEERLTLSPEADALIASYRCPSCDALCDPFRCGTASHDPCACDAACSRCYPLAPPSPASGEAPAGEALIQWALRFWETLPDGFDGSAETVRQALATLGPPPRLGPPEVSEDVKTARAAVVEVWRRHHEDCTRLAAERDAARASERERCARECEAVLAELSEQPWRRSGAEKCLARIRALGGPEARPSETRDEVVAERDALRARLAYVAEVATARGQALSDITASVIAQRLSPPSARPDEAVIVEACEAVKEAAFGVTSAQSELMRKAKRRGVSAELDIASLNIQRIDVRAVLSRKAGAR